MTATLNEALRALAVPDGDAAKERTKLLAGEMLEARRSVVAAPRSRRALAAAVVTAGGIAAFTIAPPGQAVAEWVGERLGLTETHYIELPPGVECADYTLDESGEVAFKEVECETELLREPVRER
jgi:hypothetical protein